MPYVTNDGIRIHYETEGSGSPLVLHVGFTQSLQDWYDFGYVAALRDAFRLVLIDPRGQGASDKPHDPAAYAYATRVNDILAVLDAEGIDATHYWGFSMGGRMGFAAAHYAPHRLRSLTLGADGAVTPEPEGYVAWAQRLREGGSAGVVAWWEERFGGPLPAPLRARVLASDVEALAANRIYGSASAPDLTMGLAAITLPTLVYCGERDELYPGTRAAAARIPGAAFIGLEGLGHLDGFAHSEAILPHVHTFLADVANK